MTTALISVSDKAGVVELAQQLAALGVKMLSTGGTASVLRAAGLALEDVAGYINFPEVLGGRVKTLHPRIHAGILARRDCPGDLADLQKHQIGGIDIVIVNLYPFEKTVASPVCTLAQAVEEIDIGGVTLLRAAAKNYRDVIVVCDTGDYGWLGEALRKGGVDEAMRRHLAYKAFCHTAQYDAAIAAYLGACRTWGVESENWPRRDQFLPDSQAHSRTMGQEAGEKWAAAVSLQPTIPKSDRLLAPADTGGASGTVSGFPAVLTPRWHKVGDLRYGENPHQRAAFYRHALPPVGSLASLQQLHGKEMSFNNLADADTAWECVKTLASPACVIVKHANPCAAAVGGDVAEACRRAWQGDPVSSFGGIVAFNSSVDEVCAHFLAEHFVEVVIAPAFHQRALQVLQQKKNLRLVQIAWQGEDAVSRPDDVDAALHYQTVGGGLLLQTVDSVRESVRGFRVVSRRQPEEGQLADIAFAWRVARFVKSNAIVIAAQQQTLGIGAGQMSRLDAARIAVSKAESQNLGGAVVASDGFFPFRDGLDSLAEAGVCCFVEPGGSMRDEEVIAAADEHNAVLLFSDVRHFRH